MLSYLLGRFAEALEKAEVGTVRTYANRLNQKSQKLCQKIGFTVEGQNEQGIRCRIGKENLAKRLSRFRRQAK